MSNASCSFCGLSNPGSWDELLCATGGVTDVDVPPGAGALAVADEDDDDEEDDRMACLIARNFSSYSYKPPKTSHKGTTTASVSPSSTKRHRCSGGEEDNAYMAERLNFFVDLLVAMLQFFVFSTYTLTPKKDAYTQQEVGEGYVSPSQSMMHRAITTYEALKWCPAIVERLPQLSRRKRG